MISSVPAKNDVYAAPHAFTWNMGTMSRQRSFSHSPMELALVEAIECSHVERCEYTTPLGLPVVPEV